jgi:hypothetical protein
MSLPAETSLCEILDRVLDHGVVARGEVTLSLAGIDLVYLDLGLLLCSAAKLQEKRMYDKQKLPTTAGEGLGGK